MYADIPELTLYAHRDRDITIPAQFLTEGTRVVHVCIVPRHGSMEQAALAFEWRDKFRAEFVEKHYEFLYDRPRPKPSLWTRIINFLRRNH